MLPAAVATAMLEGAVVVDTRDSDEFNAGHIPGTIHIPLGPSFSRRLKTLVDPLKRVILLVGATETSPGPVLQDAERAGIDNVTGWVGPEIMQHWIANGGELMVTPALEPAHAQMSGRLIVDVREQAEWNESSIPGARNAALGNLLEELADVPKDQPLVLQCQAGTRGSIAASILQANGFTDVANLDGGMDAWCSAGLPVSRQGSQSPGVRAPQTISPHSHMTPSGWHTNEETDAALERARITGKPILIDFWSSTCMGCAKLLKTTYTDSSVQSFIDDWFVAIKFNTSQTPERFKALNGRTLHMWHPHLLVTDSGLREARRIVGRLSPLSFIAHMRIALGVIALSRREYPSARDHFVGAAELPAPSDVTAEALYWLGVAEYRVAGSLAALEAVWSDLSKRFPDSDWTERADCLDVEIPEEGFDAGDLNSIKLLHPTPALR